MTAGPRLSVIIPAYNSHSTLRRCLEAIRRQDFDGFEVIVVDSGPSPLGAEIIVGEFPWVRLERSEQRMFPHAARNHGLSLAGSDVLVFTDPDVYPAPDWLTRLHGALHRYGGVVVGSVVWAGSRWLDRGVHLAKFDMWLPGGRPRPIPIAPTVNMITPRRLLVELGLFPGEFMIGDTVLSWRIAEAGVPITFEPAALVEHQHLSTWKELLRERFSRGSEFARLRAKHEAWSSRRLLGQLALTVIPIRWLRLVSRTARASMEAGLGADFFLTLPVVLTAHAAWLAGEAAAMVRTLSGP